MSVVYTLTPRYPHRRGAEELAYSQVLDLTVDMLAPVVPVGRYSRKRHTVDVITKSQDIVPTDVGRTLKHLQDDLKEKVSSVGAPA